MTRPVELEVDVVEEVDVELVELVEPELVEPDELELDEPDDWPSTAVIVATVPSAGARSVVSSSVVCASSTATSALSICACAALTAPARAGSAATLADGDLGVQRLLRGGDLALLGLDGLAVLLQRRSRGTAWPGSARSWPRRPRPRRCPRCVALLVVAVVPVPAAVGAATSLVGRVLRVVLRLLGAVDGVLGDVDRASSADSCRGSTTTFAWLRPVFAFFSDVCEAAIEALLCASSCGRLALRRRLVRRLGRLHAVLRGLQRLLGRRLVDLEELLALGDLLPLLHVDVLDDSRRRALRARRRWW